MAEIICICSIVAAIGLVIVSLRIICKHTDIDKD